MPDLGPLFLTLSVFAAGSILAGAAGHRLGAPMLLVFLVGGMLAGREGPGGIVFEGSNTAYLWGAAALAAILFEGGLRSRPEIIRMGIAPGLGLAVGGTVLTALAVAPLAMLAFGVGFAEGLLLGAVVSATDAAAVFALAASGARLPGRVAATLEVESGFNDPVAILLVSGLALSLAGEARGWWSWTFAPAYMLLAGAAVGLGVGAAGRSALRRIQLPEGLYAILVAAFGFVAFGLAETIGASGFLAIYVAGVTIAWLAPEAARKASPGVDGLAWLAQTGLFLMLGLYVAPSHLAAVALPAALTALALILFARPFAVALVLLRARFALRERIFIAWTGLRGATPVFLGLLPLLAGVPNANLYLSAAAAVVLVSLVVQGWTAPLVAKRLGLTGAEAEPLARSEVVPRLGAMGAALLAGVWFSVALAPERLVLPRPGSLSAVQAMLDAEGGDAAPRIAIAAFPPGFASAAAEERQPVFMAALAGTMAKVNDGIRADRAFLGGLARKERAGERLSLDEQARRDLIARTYGGRYEDLGALMRRVDEVPPSLAIAQAALATGWGGQAPLVERNAVFGRRSGEGAFGDLMAAGTDYVTLLNTHPDFAGFRAERARLRTAGKALSGLDLAAHIGPYAESGADYAKTVKAVITTKTLARYDLPAGGPGSAGD